jgi:hypothetical protein
MKMNGWCESPNQSRRCMKSSSLHSICELLKSPTCMANARRSRFISPIIATSCASSAVV